MPAQEYLDYGNDILQLAQARHDLRGRHGFGHVHSQHAQRHPTARASNFIVLTQNALADGTYVNYLNESHYGNQLKTPTADDEQQAFQDYLQDAQKRLLHDQQFPDEPKQLRPGEDISKSGRPMSASPARSPSCP